MKNDNITPAYIFLKRTVDIICAAVGCVMLIPTTVFLFFANLIAGDGSSVFYTQDRIGLNGKPFKIFKYRSMVNNAEQKLSEYLAENEEARKEYDEFKKLKNDPRITKVGNFIRKTSIDEFPQFINVLKGDMTLVGPRPYLTSEAEAMGEDYEHIIKAKPGLTGPWQVAGRNEIPFDKRLVLDREYVKKITLKKDAWYFFSTFSKLFSKKGAM